MKKEEAIRPNARFSPQLSPRRFRSLANEKPFQQNFGLRKARAEKDFSSSLAKLGARAATSRRDAAQRILLLSGFVNSPERALEHVSARLDKETNPPVRYVLLDVVEKLASSGADCSIALPVLQTLLLEGGSPERMRVARILREMHDTSSLVFVNAALEGNSFPRAREELERTRAFMMASF